MCFIITADLHGILNFPLRGDAQKRIRKKRMAMRSNEMGHLTWTYKLEDGTCTNSVSHLVFATFLCHLAGYLTVSIGTAVGTADCKTIWTPGDYYCTC